MEDDFTFLEKKKLIVILEDNLRYTGEIKEIIKIEGKTYFLFMDKFQDEVLIPLIKVVSIKIV